MSVVRFLFFLLFLFSFSGKLSAQCPNPTVMLSENFDVGPIAGAVTSSIYGNGQWNNAAYIISGAGHGWFNVINGLSNVDVYDRHVTGFCIDSAVTVSFWTRQSFGTTNVTYSAIDDNGVVLQSITLNLTNVYQQVTFNFNATTAGLQFVVHCNSPGGNGADICMEDLLITQCSNAPEETHVYGVCNQTGTIDLYALFSSAIQPGGTWSGPSTLSNGSLGTFDPLVNTNGVYQYELLNNCGTSTSTVEVEIMPEVDLGNDTTLCAGASLVLDAGAGFDEYLWSNNATTQTITVNAAGNYSVSVKSALGNLIQDPGFENGSTFFTDYVPGTGGSWGLLSNPGTYAITTSPSLVHNNFSNFADHGTTGPGNMLVVNGASVPNTNVWCQDVFVTPNTDYEFSAWVASAVSGSNVANLQFYVNGSPIGAIFSPSSSAGIWSQYQDTWNSGSLTMVTICIINQNTSGGGNDFALDDLSFAPTCTKSDDINVSIETPTQTVTFEDPLCVGNSDGAIYVDNQLAVEYSFDGGITWQIDSFLMNLNAGNYSVCSRTALGCEVCQTITLTDPDPVILSVSNDTIICENGTATMSASAIGGTSFTFHWNHTTDLNETQLVSPTSAGSYTVYAENENGCQSLPSTINVDLFDPLTGTISIFDTICPGFSTNLVASVTGGQGSPYTFSWSSGDVFTGVGNHQIIVSPLVSTDYTVTISDGCETTPIVLGTNVFVAPLPVPTVSVLNPNQCEPAEFQLVNTTANSTNTYWLVGDDQLFLNQDELVTAPMYAGSYDVQLIVTSDLGCIDSATFEDLLTVYPVPVANFNWSPSPVLMFNTQVNFTNLSYDGFTYEWFFEEGDPLTTTVENPNVEFPDGLEGTYEVMLITTSEFGCVDTISKIVEVLPEVLIYAPNSFTPDGDEYNQNWRIHIIGIDVFDFELYIYNRWGEVVWDSFNPEASWDGTYNGKPCPTGTYTWVVRAKDRINDGQYTYNGHINLLR